MTPSPAVQLGEALAHSGIGTWLRESSWAYPAVETLHILGFAVLVGSIVVVDLRLLGWRRATPLGPLLRSALPLTVLSSLVVVPTGLLLFAAHANDLVGNSAFVVKMLLIFFAATNAAMFHAGPYRAEVEAPSGSAPRASTRVFAVASIGLWVAIVVAGRWIAYV